MVKTEESISEFGDRTTKIIQFEKQRANRLGKKWSLSNPYDYKRSNIWVIRVPEGEEKERQAEKVLKQIMGRQVT